MTAEILEASVAGFASAADAVFRERRGPGDGASPSSLRAHLKQRILEVAAAVRLQDPSIFTHRVDWLRRAYQARGGDEVELRLIIESLRDALLTELPGGLRAAVADAMSPAVQSFGEACAQDRPGIAGDTAEGRLALEYLRACLEGRPGEAVRGLLAAADDGMPVERLLVEVLMPVQRETGELWHTGEVTIAEEHVVSEATKDALAILVARALPAAGSGRVVLAASVAGNAHDIGLRLICGLFRLAGWESIFLGADVPSSDLAIAAGTFRADLVLLNATLTTQLKQLQEAVAAVRAVESHPAILIGGQALLGSADIWKKFDADGFARDGEEALRVAEALVGR
jgi:methanogenic corrinoid protein MtbC1